MLQSNSMTMAVSLTTVTFALGTVSPPVKAADIEFSVAELFFELNHTDGDLGIHALIDGEPWKKLQIWRPKGDGLPYQRKLLDVNLRSSLRQQGLTEIFFESAEPTFDELEPGTFFERFPEGEYRLAGWTHVGRQRLRSNTELSHVMPAPPEAMVNGSPMAEQCDDEEPGFDITVTTAPVTISWDPVTESHPDVDGGGAGVQPPVPVVIVNYEVVVEAELEINGEEFSSVFSVIIPPDVTEMTIPEAFLDQSDTFKYEVLAREESYNQTAVESCFELE